MRVRPSKDKVSSRGRCNEWRRDGEREMEGPVVGKAREKGAGSAGPVQSGGRPAGAWQVQWTRQATHWPPSGRPERQSQR